MKHKFPRNFPRFDVYHLNFVAKLLSDKSNQYQIINLSLGGLCLRGHDRQSFQESLAIISINHKQYRVHLVPVWQQRTGNANIVGCRLFFDEYEQYRQWKLLNEAMFKVGKDKTKA